MPFTPFHFGPGAGIKAITPAKFSLLIFCYAQIVTDFESLYFLVRREYPVHRFLHTYIGATLLAGFCAVTGRFVGQQVLSIFRWTTPSLFKALVGGSARIPWGTALLSAFIGTYSHVFLDSIMHPDIKPFSPFADANPFYHAIDVGLLHLLCVLVGLVGCACLITISRPPD
jgi:hypothetical protein